MMLVAILLVAAYSVWVGTAIVNYHYDSESELWREQTQRRK